MDLDTFIAQRSADWQRLDVLARRRRLDGGEADELVTLYRRTATDLSLVQSRLPDAALSTRLSGLLSRSRAAAIGTPPVRGWSALARGLTVDFPVIVYRTWRWSVSVALASLGVSAAMWLWLRAHPERVRRVLPDSEVRKLVDKDFADYYSAHPAQSFAAHVWVNNAVVAALALFLGVTLVGTLYVLLQNTINVGLVGGIMIGSHRGELFFGLILPHGMLELTAVFVAAAIGLRTGWAWVAPGALPRAQSLAAAGRQAAVVSLGLVGVLLVSGVIEAFVTPSGLPTWARIGIGAVAEIAFVTYVVVFGRRGVRDAATGDLPDDERENLVPVV
ncbi:stage II sporulation protein M [uncultured Jatrophihabitans sp.]|uniref:stage II sporulation protein M n=1 Tax=uncultured Jatrophihabitans sp. TaxID=1610747 RepID=UPI0035CC288C